jgi:hypothetical protein
VRADDEQGKVMTENLYGITVDCYTFGTNGEYNKLPDVFCWKERVSGSSEEDALLKFRLQYPHIAVRKIELYAIDNGPAKEQSFQSLPKPK